MRTGWTKQSELQTQHRIYSLHSRPAPRREYILSEQEFSNDVQRIHFHGGDFESILMAVYSAMKSPIDKAQDLYIPAAVIQSPTANIILGWQTSDGVAYLVLEQEPDRCIKVAEEDLFQWWEWFGDETPGPQNRD